MNCWRCGGIITDDVPALKGDRMVYPTMPPKFSHAVCPEGGVYKATRLPASSVDSDSKLDLDDVAAGHPVAMRELAELRRALVVGHNSMCIPVEERLRGKRSTNCYACALLLPAPGVALRNGLGEVIRPGDEWATPEGKPSEGFISFPDRGAFLAAIVEALPDVLHGPIREAVRKLLSEDPYAAEMGDSCGTFKDIPEVPCWCRKAVGFGTPRFRVHGRTNCWRSIEEWKMAGKPALGDPKPLPWKKATHRCKVCGTLWAYSPAGLVPYEVEGEGTQYFKTEASWSVASDLARMGKCCDNAPMGDQIEALPQEKSGEGREAR